jgi:SagB-type dehydrogenase family enzyme
MPGAERPFREVWQEATDLDPRRLGRTLDWENRPEAFKSYPGARRLELPRPLLAETTPFDLWAALSRRRSRRAYSARGITLGQLAALLWACQGVTARQGPYFLRTAPSAGALYPFETYVSLQRVEGCPAGLAHLHLPTFALEWVEEGDLGPHLAHACLNQSFLAQAAAVIVWTAVLPRGAWKYGDRALRYVGLDLGHACQNLALGAEALGLPCCSVAAFLDEEVNRLLGVDGREEFAYYLAAVGGPLSNEG